MSVQRFRAGRTQFIHASEYDKLQRQHDALVADLNDLVSAWRPSTDLEAQMCADELTALIVKHKGDAIAQEPRT